MENFIVLYDGVCGLCNRAVRFIVRRDKRDLFRFAPIQSDLGKRILKRHHRNPDRLDTFVLVRDYEKETESILVKARAGLFVGRVLGGFWKLFYGFWILPDFILNFFYDLVARGRYQIFGKYDTCPLPNEKLRHKFIDQAS